MLGFLLFFLTLRKDRVHISLVLLGLVSFWFWPFWLSTSILYRTRCPDCFDDELCQILDTGKIKLHWLSKVFLTLHPQLTKSVFFGEVNETTDIVLKSMTRRLGVSQLQIYGSSEKEILEHVIRENTFQSDEHIKNAILCPNVKSFNLLFTSLNHNLLVLKDKRNLWLDVQLSIEPLLLKFLPSVNGVHVPKLYGACGDIILVEYKGKSLCDYYTSHWKRRAFLAAQLLDLAETFTFSHESLIFYFMDLTPDNMAVDTFGMIFVVDLDHVIMAERIKNSIDATKPCDQIHVSPLLDEFKLTVTPSDICNHCISDHNYFAVCKYMLLYNHELGRGLLDDLPEHIHMKYPKLESLIKECSVPKVYDSRFTAGRLLKDMLREMVHSFKWTKS